MSDQGLVAHPAAGVDRRSFLTYLGAGGALLVGGGALAACSGGVKSANGGKADALKIGYVSPKTGADAGFSEPDSYVISAAKAAIGSSLKIGGKSYDVTFVQQDSQSDPTRSGQVAQTLINSGIDLMLTSSTPETVNPVADACEAAGVPCVSTVVPWQSWYYGRGAKENDKDAFKWTYHFSFGIEDLAKVYPSLWNGSVSNNKKLGVLWPNDSDGNAIRMALGPALKQAGFDVVDPGAFPDGLNDFSAQIAKFKSEDCQILNSFAIPPDFATFWKQAAQQGYKPLLPTIAKTGLVPSQVQALGSLGPNLLTATFWGNTWPYKSSLRNITSSQLATDYENKTGKQWTQLVGSTTALFDVAIGALKASGNPKDKAAVAKAISTLAIETPVGTLDWTKGPVKNVATDPMVGCQWVKSSSGKYPLDLVMVEHSDDPDVPIAAKARAY